VNKEKQTRLGKLAQPNKTTTRPGGLLVVPPIEMDFDKWERDAMASQEKLANQTREGVS
jgi:hypothetical protein